MRKFKERILSFVLTFVMVLSLFAGMAPVEVYAEESEPPREEVVAARSERLSTFDMTLTKTGDYWQCSAIPEAKNDKYKWIYVYRMPKLDESGYEEAAKDDRDFFQEGIGKNLADKPALAVDDNEPYLKIEDITNLNNFQIPVNDEYGILVIAQIYIHDMHPEPGSDAAARTSVYVPIQIALFDLKGVVEGSVDAQNQSVYNNILKPVEIEDEEAGYKITLQLGENVPENAGIVAYDADERPIMNGDIPVYTTEHGGSITIPEGGCIQVSAVDNFSVSVSDTEIQPGPVIKQGSSYSCFIKNITKDMTVVVNKEVVQGETPTPPAIDVPLGMVVNLKDELGEDCIRIEGNTVYFDIPSEDESGDYLYYTDAMSIPSGYPEAYLNSLLSSYTSKVGEEIKNLTEYDIVNDSDTIKGIKASFGVTGEGWDEISPPQFNKLTDSTSTKTVAFIIKVHKDNYLFGKFEADQNPYTSGLGKSFRYQYGVYGVYATIVDPNAGEKSNYTITLDSSNYTTDDSLYLKVYDKNDQIQNYISSNGATATLQKGGYLKVGSRNTGDFEVFVNGTSATISEQVQVEGGSDYYYKITDITDDATIVVKPKTSGGETPTPPAHNHNMVTKYNENGHWTECSGSDCTEKTESVPHVDANTDNKCDVCEYVMATEEEPPAHTHDWTGEWTIIKEATATEEGKKETFCVSGCGQKKVVIIPKVGEVDDNGNLEKDAEVAPEAPIDEATLNNAKTELLGSNIFTDDEKALIENGDEARVWLEIDELDDTKITADQKADMENAAKEALGEDATVTYFDATLFKKVGTADARPVPTPNVKIQVTIVIPEELLNDDDDVEREYKIVRLHAGVAEVIEGTFDAATGEFTFATDKFSPYGITYADTLVDDDDKDDDDDDDDDDEDDEDDEDVDDDKNTTTGPTPGTDKKDEVPKTGEMNGTSYALTLMLLSGLGVCFSKRKKEGNE